MATPPAIFHAELAAGDPISVIVDRACRTAGAHVLPHSVNLLDAQPVGATIAIGTMKALVRIHGGEERLVRALRVLVGARRGPIKAGEISAAVMIFGFAPPDIDDRLREVIASKTAERWADIAKATGTDAEPQAAAIASAWCRALDIQPPARPNLSLRPKVSTADRARKQLRELRGQQVSKTPVPLVYPTKTTSPKSAQNAPNDLPPSNQVSPSVPVGSTGDPAPSPDRENKQALPAEPRRRAEPAPPPPRVIPAPKPAPATPVARPTAVSKPPDQADDGPRQIEFHGVGIDFATGAVTHRGQAARIHRDDGIRLVAALARVKPAILDAGRLEKAAFGQLTVDGYGRLRDLIHDINPSLARARLEIKTIAKMGHNLADLGPAGG